MKNFVTKLKDAFCKPIVFLFCIVLPYLITVILLAIFKCHSGLAITNIIYSALLIFHHALRNYNLEKEYKKLYASEFEESDKN